MINLNNFIIKKKNELHKVQVNFLRDINSVLSSLFHTVTNMLFFVLSFSIAHGFLCLLFFDIIYMPDTTLHVIHLLFQTVNISK